LLEPTSIDGKSFGMGAAVGYPSWFVTVHARNKSDSQRLLSPFGILRPNGMPTFETQLASSAARGKVYSFSLPETRDQGLSWTRSLTIMAEIY
jgi:hypothetical protein